VKTRASATRSVEDRALEWVKAAGMPLAAALITVVGGFLLKSLADQRAERESRERLYTQLLVQREQSDAAIRKDMFGVVLKEFLAETSKRDWKDKVLQLELLAHNFSQTLDLAPLFKDVARRLPKDPQAGAARANTCCAVWIWQPRHSTSSKSTVWHAGASSATAYFQSVPGCRCPIARYSPAECARQCWCRRRPAVAPMSATRWK